MNHSITGKVGHLKKTQRGLAHPDNPHPLQSSQQKWFRGMCSVRTDSGVSEGILRSTPCGNLQRFQRLLIPSPDLCDDPWQAREESAVLSSLDSQHRINTAEVEGRTNERCYFDFSHATFKMGVLMSSATFKNTWPSKNITYLLGGTPF